MKARLDSAAVPLVAASIVAGAVTWGANYFQQRALQCESQKTANEFRIVNTNINLMGKYQRTIDRKLTSLTAASRNIPDPFFLRELQALDEQVEAQTVQFEGLLQDAEKQLSIECEKHNLTSTIYAILSILITGIATYLGFVAGKRREQKKSSSVKKQP